MPEPLYERPARAVADGGRLEVLGSPPGPAGVSAVELPDGSVWEVDHVRPERLVGLDVGATADPTSSALLVAAFGGDGALFVADDSVLADDVDHDRFEDWEWGTGRGRSRGVEWAAEQAGRLILLADLANDEDLPPLARIAAAAEFAGTVTSDDDRSGGEVLGPSAPTLLDIADELSAQVGAEDVDDLEPKLRSRLGAVLQTVATDGAPARAGLVQLAELVMRPSRDHWVSGPGQAADMFAPTENGIDLVALQSPPATPPSRGDVEVVRTGPVVADVTTARSDRERWVRISRRDGLVLVAQSRLNRDGLVDRAEVAVPEDVDVDDLLVQVLDVDEIPFSLGPFDTVRAAVRAGRRAARASRLGQLRQAGERWERCAVLWEQAGDSHRARMARQLADPHSTRMGSTAPLADELAVIGQPDS